eukprot:PhM_4_TR13727/c0_g1_i2/m.39686/K01897/ACSL, fadD; long-chain acyl-CoA synthetase
MTSNTTTEPDWLADIRAKFSAAGLEQHIDDILVAGKVCRDVLSGLKSDGQRAKAQITEQHSVELTQRQAALRATVDKALSSRAVEDCREYVSLLGSYRDFVSECNQQIEDLSSNLLEHDSFTTAVKSFTEAVDEAVKKASNASPKISVPWQLRYCAENDPCAPKQEQIVEFQGGKITDADGNDIWEDACHLTATVIQSGAFGVGVPRYRSIHDKKIVRCEFIHKLHTSLAAVPAFVPVLVELDPHVTGWFVCEYDHPVFTQMHVTEAQGLARAVSEAFRVYAKRPLFGNRPTCEHAVTWLTYEDAQKRALQLANFMKDFGLSNSVPDEESFVAICASNSAEWIMWDVAAVLGEVPLVGLHLEWPEDEIVHVLTQCNVSLLVVDGSVDLESVVARCPGLHTVVVMNMSPDRQPAQSFPTVRIFTYEDVVQQSPRAADCVSRRGVTLRNGVPDNVVAREDRIFTVMYSSGTSGAPKGIVVREGSWLRDNRNPSHIYPYVVLSYSSLAHGMDRGMCWMALLQGGRVVFPTQHLPVIGRMHGVFSDARDVRPSIFIAMPYVWSSLYSDFNEFTREHGLSYEEGVQHDRYRMCLGDRVRHIATGGAPISDRLWKFLQDVFKPLDAAIVNSYGLTEAPGIATNGVLRPGVDLKLVPVPEMGYTQPNEGEICVRCKTFAKEYFRDEERTKVMFGDPDGWIHTGDVGRLDDAKHLHIIDRVAFLVELYRDGRSEWVSASTIESVLVGTVHNVRDVFVVGDRMYPDLVAVVVPHRDDDTMKEHRSRAEKEYLDQFAALATDGVLKPVEVPKAVIIEDASVAWDLPSGLRAPNGKLCRDRVKAKYLSDIERLFAR